MDFLVCPFFLLFCIAARTPLQPQLTLCILCLRKSRRMPLPTPHTGNDRVFREQDKRRSFQRQKNQIVSAGLLRALMKDQPHSMAIFTECRAEPRHQPPTRFARLYRRGMAQKERTNGVT